MQKRNEFKIENTIMIDNAVVDWETITIMYLLPSSHKPRQSKKKKKFTILVLEFNIYLSEMERLSKQKINKVIKDMNNTKISKFNI